MRLHVEIRDRDGVARDFRRVSNGDQYIGSLQLRREHMRLARPEKVTGKRSLRNVAGSKRRPDVYYADHDVFERGTPA